MVVDDLLRHRIGMVTGRPRLPQYYIKQSFPDQSMKGWVATVKSFDCLFVFVCLRADRINTTVLWRFFTLKSSQSQWISEFYRSKTKSCVRRCPPGMLIKDFFSRERIGVFERKQQKRRKTALLMKRPDNFHPWFLSQVRNTANETWSVPLSYTLLWGCSKFQLQ